MANIIKIFLEGQDAVSPKIAGIRQNVLGLSSSVSGVGLAVAGWSTAFSAAGNLLGKISGSFKDAVRAQGDQITTAGTFAAVTGKSFGDSLKFVRDFNKELTIVANDLPGTAQDYKTIANAISDNLVGAFKDAKGNLDIKPFKQALTDISSSFGALSVSSGVDSFSTSDAVARLLDGQVGALKLIFFDKNPVVRNLLTQELQKQGKQISDWAALDIKQRAKILQTVSKQTLTPDLVKASSVTIEAITGTIQSTLFDPESGIFGLLRQVDLKNPNSTVLAAFGQALQAGVDFVTQVNRVLKALGVDLGDPMKRLYNVTLYVAAKIRYVTDSLSKLADVIGVGGISKESAETAIRKFYNNFGFGLNQLTTKVFNFIGDNAPAIINFVTKLINTTTEAIPLIVSSINWASFGANIGKILANINWVDLLKAAFYLQLPGLVAGGFARLGLYIAGWFTAQATAAFASFVGIPLVQSMIGLGRSVAALITTSAASLTPPVLGLIGAAVGIWYYNYTLVKDRGKDLEIIVNQGFEYWGLLFKDMLQQGQFVFVDLGLKWQGFTGWLGNQWQSILNAGQTFTDSFMEKWTSLQTFFSSQWDGVVSSVTGFIDNVKRTVSGFFGGGSSTPSPQPGPSPQFIGPPAPAYKGYIPNAAGGFFDAVARENRAKPPGSSLLIANTSETVLTRQQVAQLRGGGITVGSVNVYAAPGQDARSLAHDIMRELDAIYAQYTNTRLVAG